MGSPPTWAISMMKVANSSSLKRNQHVMDCYKESSGSIKGWQFDQLKYY
jgi:hypothetical protein